MRRKLRSIPINYVLYEYKNHNRRNSQKGLMMMHYVTVPGYIILLFPEGKTAFVMPSHFMSLDFRDNGTSSLTIYMGSCNVA